MTRRPNLYFFRDVVGYKPSEIAERINIDDLRSEPTPVRDILDDANLDHSILDQGKHEILSEIRDAVKWQRYVDFMEEILDERGQKGDKANLQIYSLQGLNYQDLINTLEDAGSDSESGDHILNSVSQFRELDDQNAVDIQFKVVNIGDYVSQGNLEVVGDNTEAISFEHFVDLLEENDVLEDIGIDINALREKEELEAEARVYFDSGLIFVSNREIWDQLQTDIRDRINRWAGSASSTGGIQLRETELLYFQNAMSGDNSGLDFGNFIDNRLNTAKYRGPRQETLTRSNVLQPAQNEGEITQVRFYYSYDSWNVQVRIHRDGHLTTTKETRPDFANKIEDHLGTILEVRKFLTPIDERISEFASEKQRQHAHFNQRNYRVTRKRAFEKLVDDYIVDEAYSESEIQVFASILANFFISLGQMDLNSDELPNPEELDDDEYPEDYRELKTFVEDYLNLKIGIPAPEFDTLLEHINYIFTNLVTHPVKNPADIIESAEEEYDIRG